MKISAKFKNNKTTHKEKNDNNKETMFNTFSFNSLFNTLFLIMFFILSFLVFYINNIFFYIFILTIVLLILLFKKIRIIELIRFNFYTFFSFSIIIFITNLFLMTINESFNILIKLTLACNLSYTLFIMLPSYKLIKTLEILIKPLKIFKINITTISLIISIGITFIPILFNEIQKIRLSLVAKGIKYNSISNIFYMLKILIPNLLKKVNDIDYSLSAKGFNE